MSDILILGSAGFIGSNITNYLIQHTQYNIASVDDLSVTPDLKKLQPAILSKNRHTFYLAKAQDREICQKILQLEQPKTVVFNIANHHLATIDQSNQWSHMNTLTNWVAWCYQWGVKHFVIYLNHLCIYEDLDLLQEEYVRVCEEYATGLNRQDINISLLTSSYVFGPRESADRPLAQNMLSALKGDGQPGSNITYDYIYVKDFYFAMQKLIDGDVEPGFWELIGAHSASLSRVKEYLLSLIDTNVEKFHFGRDEAVRKHNWNSVPKDFPIELQYGVPQALEHTLCWYDLNKWAWE